MATRDLHAALKTEVVTNTTSAGVQFVVARLQNSKDDSKLSLHAAPNSYSTAGIQTTDFLKYLGFVRGSCAFVRGECYSIGIPSDFDLANFAVAFANSYVKLEEAEKHLDKCAFFLPQPEGWGYFFGKLSDTQGRRHTLFTSGGDGHTAPKSESLKTSEDEYFNFILSFMSGGHEYEKGWVFHYHPKHMPLSAEIRGALKFFDLKPFNQCPFFDFEPCYWRFTAFQEREDEVFSNHTHFVHESFDSHTEHFSKGIEVLLSAQSAMIPFGMSFIPLLNESIKSETVQVSQATMRAKRMSPPHRKFKYDVALSFAGTEREHAEKLANLVRENGFEVFYDNFYPDQLWGKDLVVFFDQIYRKDSRYCVMFVSKEYSSRMWTNHERRSAQARLLEERGAEYILPIQVDDAELPGMPSTMGHLSLSEHGIDRIGEILLKKLGREE